jgi:hypothetical protein
MNVDIVKQPLFFQEINPQPGNIVTIEIEI